MVKKAQIEVYPLERIQINIFKKRKLGDPYIIRPKEVLDDCKNLNLAVRFCDSTYHLVNSELSKVLKEKRNLLTKSLVTDLVSALVPDESVHGQRYIIYQKNKQAFLVGDTVSALKKLSN
jgi:hypothetical protein